MTRATLLVASLAIVTACSPKEPGGRKVVAAESTLPLMDSAPAAEKATPLLERGAPAVNPALATGDVLSGSSWAWLFTQTPGEKVAAPEPANYVLAFGTDGRVSGKADCNRMTGAYKADAERLTLSAMATTRMACPPGSLGDRFAHDLGLVRSYAFSTPDTLRLTMEADAGTMTFRRSK